MIKDINQDIIESLHYTYLIEPKYKLHKTSFLPNFWDLKSRGKMIYLPNNV